MRIKCERKCNENSSNYKIMCFSLKWYTIGIGLKTCIGQTLHFYPYFCICLASSCPCVFSYIHIYLTLTNFCLWFIHLCLTGDSTPSHAVHLICLWGRHSELSLALLLLEWDFLADCTYLTELHLTGF